MSFFVPKATAVVHIKYSVDYGWNDQLTEKFFVTKNPKTEKIKSPAIN